MNKSDSERIAAVLENIGCRKATDIQNADLIIFNMCAVRQAAVDRVYGQLKNIKKIKAKNKKIKIFLTGCILDCDKKKLSDRANLIFDIRSLNKIMNYELRTKNISQRLTSLWLEFKIQSSKFENYDYLKIKPKYKDEKSAFVPIMTGCNNFCSYCAVPYTRGREYSRSAKDILNEVSALLKNGCKKITLLGQNVNSYCSKFQNPKIKNQMKSKKSNDEIIDFSILLKMINNLKGDFEINFLTSHPKDMSDKLIEEIAKCEKISKNLHLPFQSGSNAILKKMNRGYTRQDYLSLIKKIKNRIPDIKFSTDVIVGFPGETKKQFEKTVGVIKKVEFYLIYANKYSPRKEALAAKIYKDNISIDKKKLRWRIINDFNKR